MFILVTLGTSEIYSRLRSMSRRAIVRGCHCFLQAHSIEHAMIYRVHVSRLSETRAPRVGQAHSSADANYLAGFRHTVHSAASNEYMAMTAV